MGRQTDTQTDIQTVYVFKIIASRYKESEHNAKSMLLYK